MFLNGGVGALSKVQKAYMGEAASPTDPACATRALANVGQSC